MALLERVAAAALGRAHAALAAQLGVGTAVSAAEARDDPRLTLARIGAEAHPAPAPGT
jgi:hypothetical protein